MSAALLASRRSSVVSSVNAVLGKIASAAAASIRAALPITNGWALALGMLATTSLT
ncbi:hypothetical protein [Micromonospora sp. NBC_00617]|uniref:hypothetical protein n=1 Tax=Micromonospora sp. NBC_00617 TaxID=2903587 RepID=UPI00386ACEB9